MQINASIMHKKIQHQYSIKRCAQASLQQNADIKKANSTQRLLHLRTSSTLLACHVFNSWKRGVLSLRFDSLAIEKTREEQNKAKTTTTTTTRNQENGRAMITVSILLISMLWHRQAIFESKGNKLSSSAEYRLWLRVSGTESPAECTPAYKLTKLLRVKLKSWTQ